MFDSSCTEEKKAVPLSCHPEDKKTQTYNSSFIT